jgi:hypothetical protein
MPSKVSCGITAFRAGVEGRGEPLAPDRPRERDRHVLGNSSERRQEEEEEEEGEAQNRISHIRHITPMSVRRTLKASLNGYAEVERDVRAATCNDQLNPSATLLAKISEATKDRSVGASLPCQSTHISTRTPEADIISTCIYMAPR